MMVSERADLESLLERTWGYRQFRPLQREIVESVLAGRDVLALMPTGGGKSICYQLPSLVLEGVTVVISPLIALMKDQVDSLRQVGIEATFMNSTLTREEVSARTLDVVAGKTRIVYVAPERADMNSFRTLLQHVKPALFAVDEAHCISHWGHDFRPEYRQLIRLRELFPAVPVAAFTATATQRVRDDIAAQLGLRDPARFVGSFNRPNLTYKVVPKNNSYPGLLHYLKLHRMKSGIIYCGTRAGTEDLAQRLRLDGVDAIAYHAGLRDTTRSRNQEAFIQDRVRVVVATVAFGMGIDKPDVRFVIHRDLPKNLESYYQESGRAGRDGDPAECILYFGRGDVRKLAGFLDDLIGEEKAHARAQLDAMEQWAETAECRRRLLLRYFGEDLGEPQSPCCDNCSSGATERDVSVEAQMFLSCVKRTGERFGSSHIIDVLRQSRSGRIVDLRHDKLSTYGIGKHWSKEEWSKLASVMVQRSLLVRDQFGSLSVTSEGADVLFGRAPLKATLATTRRVRKPATRRRDQDPGGTSDHSVTLYDELVALRSRIAQEEGIAPYMVLSDKALRSIAAELPTTRDQLRRLPGLGEHKVLAFGNRFVDVVKQWTVARPVFRPGSHRVEIFDMVGNGMSLEDVARARGIAVSTARKYLVEELEVGHEVNLDHLIEPDRLARIAVAFNEVGLDRLSPVRERLGEEFSYDELDIARGYLRGKSAREALPTVDR